MAQAVKCPVCEGKGVLPDGDDQSTVKNPTKVCHGCEGRGWVEVGSNVPRFPDYPLYPLSPYTPPYYPTPVWITWGETTRF